jgi:hypothetical protein
MEEVMPDALHNVHQEYWRPPAQPPHAMEPASGRGQLNCSLCGAEFVVGARFCHVCGAKREALANNGSPWERVLDFTRIRKALGLSIGALVAFVFGMGCIIAAIATGFVYSAATALDWEAVQIWRIEWLLAAAAALLTGILLKKSDVR